MRRFFVRLLGWLWGALLLSIFLGLANPAQAQRSDLADERYYTEWQDQLKFFANAKLVEANVARIKWDLMRYSNKTFPIYPVPNTGRIGLALNGGVILLDGGTLGKSPDVLAFWMAHEWAHQDLSHSRNAYSTPEALWSAFMAKTLFTSAREDAADIYAGRFLATAGYPVEGALANLCALPASSGPHSSGRLRAQNVADAYASVRKLARWEACGGGDGETPSGNRESGMARNTLGGGNALGDDDQPRRTRNTVDDIHPRRARNTVPDLPSAPRTHLEPEEATCWEDNPEQCRGEATLERAMGNIPKALAMLEAGCDSNIALACGDLATLLFTDSSGAESEQRLYFTSAKACDLESVLGCFVLGAAYAFGLGTEENTSHALSAYEKACELDFLQACVRAGEYLQWEEFGEAYTTAVKYFERACDGDIMEGCWRLGILYGDGDGVEEDDAREIELYAKACAGDSADGCWWSGIFHDDAGNYGLALPAFRKGCEGGDNRSCYDYGRYYMLGLGTERNTVVGHALLRQVCRDDSDYTAKTFACRWLDENDYDR